MPRPIVANLLLSVLGLLLFAPAGQAVPVVPGTGTLIDYVGDDFEDADWKFIHNHPKSSEEINGNTGGRQGRSANGRWFEGPKRGQPDQMQVYPTPPGGLEGSKLSLYMRTLDSGIPKRLSYQTEQDDLIVDCQNRLRTSIKPSETPNFVVRIYLPEPQHWENRSGPHFGLRAGCSATAFEKSDGFFGGTKSTHEPYWPGIWIHFRSETSKQHETDSAFIKVRGDRRGRDFFVREMEEFGWWTLGMSITPDGMVHYYASHGVDDLTAEDHLTSQFPYSFTALSFRTFFFNICNRNDGKSWSTPFLIDDPQLYLVNATRIVSIIERKEQQQRKIAEAKKAREERIAKQREQARQRTEARKQELANRREKSRQQRINQQAKASGKSESGEIAAAGPATNEPVVAKQTPKPTRRRVVRRRTASRQSSSRRRPGR